MTKPNFADALVVKTRQERAIDEAREILRQKGIAYPILDSSMPNEENYLRMMAYAEQEANLVIQLLRKPVGGDRPLEVDNVEKTEPWKPSWYD